MGRLGQLRRVWVAACARRAGQQQLQAVACMRSLSKSRHLHHGSNSANQQTRGGISGAHGNSGTVMVGSGAPVDWLLRLPSALIAVALTL